MAVLSNKVAIITGASSGIGFETAKLFAKEGARVVVCARRKAKLDELVDAIRAEGGTAMAVPGDVGEESHARLIVERTVSEYGGLDVAFNNAGVLGATKPFEELSLSEWDNTLQTNLTSAFMCAKFQIPAMLRRGGGSMVFTSSFVGHTVGMPSMSDYAASKAGMIGLTRALASEFGARRIRVNALLPGGTDTPMGRSVASTPEALEFVRSLHGLKRIARPEEIARSALYLASDASSFTTGTALLADGGVSISRT